MLSANDLNCAYLDLLVFNIPKLKIIELIGPGGILGFTASNFSLINNASALTKYPNESSILNFSEKNIASGLSTSAVLLMGLFLS